MPDDALLVLFAVRNRDGRYFRAKGLHGYGRETWVDGLAKARIYAKIGPARRTVTYFATQYPQLGVPELVFLVVTRVEAVRETDRILRAQQKMDIREGNLRRRQAENQLEEALRRAAEAQRRLDEIRHRL